MVEAFVALGANLGDKAAALKWAVRGIGALPATAAGRVSSLYQTAPIVSQHMTAGGDYFNAVMAIHTALSAPALLGNLQRLEQLAGRERPYPDAPRTLDLDLLLYGDARIDSKRLTVPHPRMGQRAFVLVPLAEIAPERVTPAALQAVANQAISLYDPHWLV